jgi:hypothetical protein
MDKKEGVRTFNGRENTKASRSKTRTNEWEESMNIEDKNEIISSKMSKFGKGFKIPDDKTDMQ